MESPFLGQLAVVTGAGGAIGQAIARRLLARGAGLRLIARTNESLELLKHSANWPQDRVHFHSVDLEKDEAIRHFCLNVINQSSVNVLVHCAGVITLDAMQDARIEDLDRQYRVNVRAPYLLTQALLPRLTACRGQIVFVNSSAGQHARKGAGQYAVTKHALRGLADSLREEVNERGVRVLSIFLGRTASKMQASVYAREGRSYQPEVLLQPDDVASVIVHALELPKTAEVTDINLRPLLKSY